MAASRDELRERLVAALEASPELTSEHRAYLADVFLDGLTEEYQLVPKSAGRSRTPNQRDPGFDPSQLIRQWWPVAALAVVAIVLLPTIVMMAFAGPHMHGFSFMPFLLLFLAWRFLWRGPGRGRYYRR